MARTLLPIDELNVFRSQLVELAESGNLKTKSGKKRCIDILLDLLIMAYVLGNDGANEMLGSSTKVSTAEMQDTIYRKIDGKTFEDRVNEYADEDAKSAINKILRVAETEMHNAYDSSAHSTAVKGGARRKRWHTMMDDKVRDQHDYLHGMTIGIDDEFYTYTGAHGLYPGGFDDPENDVNCRCWLEYMK